MLLKGEYILERGTCTITLTDLGQFLNQFLLALLVFQAPVCTTTASYSNGKI